MGQQKDELAAQRKYFIYVGIAAAFIISGWYMYRLHLQKSLPGMQSQVDPVWTQFVNVILIFFATIFQCSILHKLYMAVVRSVRKRRNR